MTTADAIAGSVRSGAVTASDVVADAMAEIARRDADYNSFISVFADGAPADAAGVDTAREGGAELNALAGVPFAAKDLFDVAGLVTTAGSIIHRDNPPAAEDATAVRRLREAGAVLVGRTNMDELAYGFTTENPHYGATRNPRDPERTAGGSSGGSAAAVAAGLVPVALGSDTNGSVRVPAALCGVYGFKPTYGRISRAGATTLAWSFDHVGWFARTVHDIAMVFDALQGPDPRDPVCTDKPPVAGVAALDRGRASLRIGVAGGHFATGGLPEAFAAVRRVADALDVPAEIEVPEAARAVAASLLITSAEAASLYLDDIRARPADFDPHTRDRWIAATMIPAVWVHAAQRFRRAFAAKILKLFDDIDVLIAPTTAFPAPALGQGRIEIDGAEVPVRGTLARFVAPFSFVGCPAMSVPVWGDGKLPMGVQIVAAPHNDTAVLRVAAELESNGVTEVPTP